MTEYKNQSELVQDFDQLLGRFIRKFELLQEITLTRVMQLGMGTSEPGERVDMFLRCSLSELSFRARLNILEMILTVLIRACPEYKASNQKLVDQEIERALITVKAMFKLEEHRNRFIHSTWWVLGENSDSEDLIPITRMKIKASAKNPMVMEEFSPDTLRELIEEANQILNELGESTGRLLGLLDYDEGKKQVNS